jgi:predicted transcriptional regulator
MARLTVAHFFPGPMKKTSVTLPVEMIALLDQIAEQRGISRSAAVAGMLAKSPNLGDWRANAKAHGTDLTLIDWLMRAA